LAASSASATSSGYDADRSTGGGSSDSSSRTPTSPYAPGSPSHCDDDDIEMADAPRTPASSSSPLSSAAPTSGPSESDLSAPPPGLLSSSGGDETEESMDIDLPSPDHSEWVPPSSEESEPPEEYSERRRS
jgi:hypothetical protein